MRQHLMLGQNLKSPQSRLSKSPKLGVTVTSGRSSVLSRLKTHNIEPVSSKLVPQNVNPVNSTFRAASPAKQVFTGTVTAIVQVPLTNQQDLLRKIQFLETRVVQLHQEKNQISLLQHQTNMKLRHENSELVAQLARAEVSPSTPVAVAKVENTQTSLEIHEPERKLHSDAIFQDTQSFRNEENRLSDRKADSLNRQNSGDTQNIEELQVNIVGLRNQNQQLEMDSQQAKRKAEFTQIMHQQQKQIRIKFQNDIFVLQSELKTAYQVIEGLKTQIQRPDDSLKNSTKQEQLLFEIEQLKRKLAQASGKECQRCEDLLKTIFKLNSQLSRP